MSANPSQCFFFLLGTVNSSSKRQVKCNCSIDYFGGNANDLNSASFCEQQTPNPLIVLRRRTTSVPVLTISGVRGSALTTPILNSDIFGFRFLNSGVVAVDSAFALSYTRVDVQASLVMYCPFTVTTDTCYNNSNMFNGSLSKQAPMRYLDIIPPLILSLSSCLHCSTLTPNDIDFHVDLNPNIPGYVNYLFDHTSAIIAQQIGLGIYNPSLTSVYVNISTEIPLSGKFNISVMAFEKLTGDSKIAVIMNLTISDCAPLGLQNRTGLNPCQHGGVCLDNSNPFDGNFLCDCNKTGYKGTFCETLLPVVLIQQSSATDSTPTYVGIGVGVSVPLILLILLGTYSVRRAIKDRLNRKDYHIFISYRVKCDADIAEKLCLKLQEYFITLKNMKNIHVRCFLDKQDITDGTEWKKAFIQALEHCCLFVPIVSEAGLNPMKFIKPTDVKEDNVLLEYEIASKLSMKGRLNIFPILVGGGARGMLLSSSEPTHERTPTALEPILNYDFSQFGSHCFPRCLSLTSTETVSETLTYILGFQGVKLADAQKLTLYPNSGAGGTVFPKRISSTSVSHDSINNRPTETADSCDLAANVIQVFTTLLFI